LDFGGSPGIYCGITVAVILNAVKNLSLFKHFDYMPGKIFVDFSVSWDWLGDFGCGILIPVVFPLMPDE